MGSQTSLDVDRIQKKNDARLRRLHQMNSKILYCIVAVYKMILLLWFQNSIVLNKSAKNAALRSKSNDLLARNQSNVFEWGDMSIRCLLFQWASTITKIQLQWVAKSICHPRFYVIIYLKFIVKSFLTGFWSFLHQKNQKYLKIIFFIILAWFSVRLPIFSYGLKTIFVFWCQICYIF